MGTLPFGLVKAQLGITRGTQYNEWRFYPFIVSAARGQSQTENNDFEVDGSVS